MVLNREGLRITRAIPPPAAPSPRRRREDLDRNLHPPLVQENALIPLIPLPLMMHTALSGPAPGAQPSPSPRPEAARAGGVSVRAAVGTLQRAWARCLASCPKCPVRERTAQPVTPKPVAATRPGAYGDAFMRRFEQSPTPHLAERDFLTPEGIRDSKRAEPPAPIRLHQGGTPGGGLSPDGKKALRAICDWQLVNPANSQNTGNQLLRANGPAERAIAEYLKQACWPALEPLLEATLEGASRDVEDEERKRSGATSANSLALGKDERQLILLKHIETQLLGRPGEISAMRGALPTQARAFLRALREQVDGWLRASPASDIDIAITVSHVLPATFVLRGLAPLACSRPRSDRPSRRDALRPDLGALLTSLASHEPKHTAASTGHAAQLRAAKAAVRVRFQEELAALVDFPALH